MGSDCAGQSATDQLAEDHSSTLTLQSNRCGLLLGVPPRILAVVGRNGAGIGPVVQWLRFGPGRNYAHVHMVHHSMETVRETGHRLSSVRHLSATEIIGDDGRSVVDRVIDDARSCSSDTVIEGVGHDSVAVRCLQQHGVAVDSGWTC